ncbi:MAG: aminomethyl-transferring glycine dehydrogenase subunit GcvPA [Deltaproteobacteria bacterium]|nr:aminomethyl-transferring glycine dehydrogenase subunit GcvPA [Deltaproteobacteria bacterium]
MRYIPHTAHDIESMLKAIDAKSVEELFLQIPDSARFKGKLNLPKALSEPELKDHMEKLAALNSTDYISFMGAGTYNHFIPAAVDQLLLRSEFYTAYTPYQPEISQGTLQAIFEFQSSVCRIFDMETANASMYDGATALVEAALMSRRVTKRHKIAVSEGIHPEYVETLKTYIEALDNSLDAIIMVPADTTTGATDLLKLEELLDKETACFLVGYPNFFGVAEPVDSIVSLCKKEDVKVVTSTLDPFAFAIIAPPGQLGVDIATAEGQAIACPQSYGGPGIGLFSIKDDKKLLRQMPGRLAGKTLDKNGKDGFVLTLATREQHIRREKATSNICSNHGLLALSSVINTSLLGKEGFVQAASYSFTYTDYFIKKIKDLENFEVTFNSPVFNEFCITCKTATAKDVLNHLQKVKIAGGVSLDRFGLADNRFLVAVTEKIKKADIDNYIKALQSF